MKTKEYFNKWNLEHYFQSGNEHQLLSLMNDYAKEKCQELLLLVADKAEVEQTVYFSGKDNTLIEKVFYTESDGHFKVNTDSILNAVNLDEFIK